MKKLVDFFVSINKLKKVLRYSTCPDNVRDSSSDHSWKLALMVIQIAEKLKLNLDILHASKIALVHDLPEYIEGDIDSLLIKRGQISYEQKSAMEERAAQHIRDSYEFGEDLYNLWKEFEDSKTKEAKYVKALDKIEALTHLISIEYVARHDDDEAELTATYADNAVREFPELIPLLKATKTQLKNLYQKIGYNWKPEYDYPNL